VAGIGLANADLREAKMTDTDLNGARLPKEG